MSKLEIQQQKKNSFQPVFLRYFKAGLRPVPVSFTLSSVWWRMVSKIIFLRNVIRPFRKMRNGLIVRKEKVLRCPHFALILDFLSVTVWAKKNWKYCFDPKLHVWFCYKMLKGVFRAHCTQIWGTSRLAFDRYLLVLHYQVYGEERFPKLFSYEKFIVRFAKYQNVKRAHCTKSESTKVPKFCTGIRLFKCNCMSRENFENVVSIQSYFFFTCMILLQNLKRCV